MVRCSWVIMLGAMTEDTSARNKRLLGLAFKGSFALTAASAFIAGIVGAFVAVKWGQPAAMYWSIVLGNTEPAKVDLPYPWGWFWFGQVVNAIGTVMLKGDRGWLVASIVLLTIGAIILVFLPFFHIWRLVGAM